VRTYGFLANRHRAAKLSQCREAIADAETKADDEMVAAAADGKLRQCPVCLSGRLACVLVLLPADLARCAPVWDTS
jgi:hypothetical protein